MCSTLSIGVCCNCVSEAFSRGISMDILSPFTYPEPLRATTRDAPTARELRATTRDAPTARERRWMSVFQSKFPQFFLVDLAYQVAWQRVHKLDLAGRFVVRQRFATKGFEGLGIDINAGNDEGFDFFAHPFGWDADDCRFDHCRMAVENLFNVTRVDVESTANNQVFFTFNDIQITIFVEPSHISSIQPAIAQGRLRFFGHIVVALHDIGTTCDDLAHLTGGHGLIIVIDDAYFNTIDRCAN